jgi:hypothetical protein
MAVTAIAERAVLRVLATAPRDGFCFGDIHFARPEAGAFVRAVAERLRLRRAARTPPKGARPGFLNKWRFLGNKWLAHGGLFNIIAGFPLQSFPCYFPLTTRSVRLNFSL